MKVNGRSQCSIWVSAKNPRVIQVIDQRFLPHRFVIEDLKTLEDTAKAIEEMHVRGAPLIGVTAAYGIYLALLGSYPTQKAYQRLLQTRPTAVNLKWALDSQLEKISKGKDLKEKIKLAFENANQIREEDIRNCKKIGDFGLEIIRKISQSKKGKPVQILTHCNAGWLACVDWGTKTAPIYRAFEEGIALHIWVDETRPRNQGASLTAWEFQEHGIPHTLIVDNAGGQLMQKGKIDLVLVGSDRTTRTGDVANKIGTYLKAIAAKENGIPFYVCLPSSSIDWNIRDGLKEIKIEERAEDEVRYIEGLSEGERKIKKVLIAPQKTKAFNIGFDITPARFVTGLVTEKGICEASEKGLLKLFPQ